MLDFFVDFLKMLFFGIECKLKFLVFHSHMQTNHSMSQVAFVYPHSEWSSGDVAQGLGIILQFTEYDG